MRWRTQSSLDGSNDNFNFNDDYNTLNKYYYFVNFIRHLGG